MRKKYIRPRIGLIPQSYVEGVMQTISMPVSTTPSTAQDSKLVGDWGMEGMDTDAWDDQGKWSGEF